MKHLGLPVLALVMTLACAVSEHAVAGPYGDDMAKCLVSSTSPADRTLLIKWLFGAMALHPDLASLSVITTEQRDSLTQNAGALFQRLLIESCKTETQQAIKNEGAQTIESAFRVLGEVAMRGLMTEPRVVAGLKDLDKSIDKDKLKAALYPDTPK